MTTLFLRCTCLLLEDQLSISVHDPLGQVDVTVNPLVAESLELGPQDGLVLTLDVETDVLGRLGEVCGSVSTLHLDEAGVARKGDWSMPYSCHPTGSVLLYDD